MAKEYLARFGWVRTIHDGLCIFTSPHHVGPVLFPAQGSEDSDWERLQAELTALGLDR